MKKIATLCLTTLLALTSASSAQADWGRHGGYRGDFPRHEHYGRGSGWVGPAAVLAITGLAIGAAVASQSRYAAPAPVYAPPPPQPVPQPAYNVWYYCNSSGQYYPYTNACPEGWQAVPAQ